MKRKKEILAELAELATQLLEKEDSERSNYDAVYLDAPDEALQTDVHNDMRGSIKALNYCNYEIQCAILKLKKSINKNDV